MNECSAWPFEANNGSLNKPYIRASYYRYVYALNLAENDYGDGEVEYQILIEMIMCVYLTLIGRKTNYTNNVIGILDFKLILIVNTYVFLKNEFSKVPF